jgi:uncharacterized protein
MRLLIVPRWAGSAESDFYRWLERELYAQHPGLFREVAFTVLPNPPDLTGSTQQVLAALQDAPGETLVMGHSVGFQAAMRAVAALSEPVAGLFGVAPWWSVDAPWPTLLPWIETPFSYQNATKNAAHRQVVLSDNDPYTSDYQEATRLFTERLSAQTKLVPNAKHFNQAEEPAVLAALIGFAETIRSGRSR